MFVGGRHQNTQANGSSYGLGHLSLVDGSQIGLVAVLDTTDLGHVLGHDAEVLCHTLADEVGG